MSVLVDTSVWVSHFRSRNNALIDLIEADLALTHPIVLIELACGTPPAPRTQTLNDIGLLQPANQASLTEVMAFIEHEKLHGLGYGLVDVALLASTLITPGAQLWTLDKRLADLSARFGVAHHSSCTRKGVRRLGRQSTTPKRADINVLAWHFLNRSPRSFSSMP